MRIELTADDDAYMPPSQQRAKYVVHRAISRPSAKKHAAPQQPPPESVKKPVLPLPQWKPKSLEARLAESEKLRGVVPDWHMKEIREAILDSGEYFGEHLIVAELPPEVSRHEGPKIVDIQRVVARRFSLCVKDILRRRRTTSVVRPRQISMYLAKVLTPHGVRAIGRRFCRDPSTIRHAVRKIGALVETDKALAEDIAALREILLA